MNENLSATKENLLRGLRDFMVNASATYDEDDVVDCGRIIDRYVETLAHVPDRATARDAARTAVLALNELNNRCEGELIETDQREQICAIIIEAGALRGFNGPDEDVTEDWREW
jgi:hypothetical protein